MIIHRIHAKNVLKYNSLRLDDLPSSGLIAITGPNESGKSTIGETLCFALFGRTFSLDYEDLTKVIHWGETHCSVEIDFTASDGERYTLERYLDDSGNHSARIGRAGEAKTDEPLARGIEKVADMLYELIGYEYEEFIESFYLAQREITTPHPHSYAVKTMAGLVTLEYCKDSFGEEVKELQQALAATEREAEGLSTQIDEVGLDASRLPVLQAERTDLNARQARYNRQVGELDSASIDYQDALPKRHKALKAKGTAGFFGFISLLLALALGGAWGLLTKLPEHPFAQKLGELLSANLPNWHEGMILWLLYGAAGFAILFVLFQIRRGSQNRRLKEMAEIGPRLSSTLDELDAPESMLDVPSDDESDAETEEDSQVTEPVAEEATETAAEEEPQAQAQELPVDRAARERLSQRANDFQADFAEVREGIGSEQNLLRQAIDLIQARISRLDGEIAVEQEKIAKVETLTTMRDDLKQKNEERRHHIEMAELAAELVQGTMREVSYQFNRKVRGLVGKTLPLFTDNRYEHLQIDDDLSVRAFSSEKHDFMDLEEISSGTQRQIMLAVRLALSQELVGRAVKADQFLFLDEPFAFFDQARTRSSLTVLPTLSDQLKQIWIIGQEFPDDIDFDRHIKCERDFLNIPPLET